MQGQDRVTDGKMGGLLGNVQALRAVAALMIVVVHLAPLLATSGLGGDIGLFQAGVDVFFVISGFIMLHISRDRMPGPGAFLHNRVIRIVPAYWLVSLLFLAAATALHQWQADGAGLGLLVRSLFFLPSGDPPLYYPLLYVGWSLNFEMFFYLLFALTLALKLAPLARTTAVAALLTIPVTLVGLRLVPPSLADFYGNPIVYEFVLGMLLGLAWPWLGRVPVWVGWLGIVAGPLAMVLLHPLVEDVHRLFLAGFPGAVIVAAALVLERHGRSVRNGAVLLIGAASYVLYLSHPIVISAFNNLSRHFAPLRDAGAAQAMPLAALAACLIAAIILHRGFELPVSRWLRRGGKGG